MKTFRNYRYRLGKLHTVCPNCHRRTFKPYVDAKGAIFAPEVGRCNREVKCGYHLRPREWMGSGDVARLLPARATPVPRTDFVPRRIMDATMRRDVWRLNLFRWFARRFGWQRARKVFSLYFVTYSRSMGGAALFWFVDDKLRVRTGKLMAYDRSAHRRRDLTVAVRFIHQSIRRGFVCRLCCSVRARKRRYILPALSDGASRRGRKCSREWLRLMLTVPGMKTVEWISPVKGKILTVVPSSASSITLIGWISPLNTILCAAMRCIIFDWMAGRGAQVL